MPALIVAPGDAINFYAQFNNQADGLGATGLTVTVSVNRDTSNIVSVASATAATEVDATNQPGLYRYTLSGGSTGTVGEYTAQFKTATTTVESQSLVCAAEVAYAKVDVKKWLTNDVVALGASGGVPLLDSNLSILANALFRGTASAGGSNTITLAGGVATDNYYRYRLVSIISGTGTGQSGFIVKYDGTSKVATVNKTWPITPDNTSVFVILPFATSDIAHAGIAQAGGASTITLDTIASATDNLFKGMILYIAGGTGAGQARIISNYVGSTKVATVNEAWVTNPDSTSVYQVMSFGRSWADVFQWNGAALVTPDISGEPKVTVSDKTGFSLSSASVQAVWDALTSALVTSGSIGKLLVDKVDTVLSTIYSRIGAPAGASVSADIAAVKVDTAASQTSESTLLSRLSSARAGYLDNLNVGGNVASSAEVVGIQNNTRVVRVVNDVFERPDSGSTAFRVELLIYDEVGNMEAPDSAPTIGVVNQGGTSRDANLDSTTMSLVSTGRYRSTYTIDTDHVLEQLVFSFSVVEGSATRVYANPAQVVDTTAVDFTSTDRTNLGAIKTQTDLLAFTSGKVNAQVKAIDADAITAAAIATDAIDADAIKTDAVTEIQSGLSTLNAAGIRTAVGLASANLDTQLGAIDDFVDTEVAAIKAKTDLIPASPAATGDIPSVSAIADQVWDELLSGHTTTGSAGKKLSDAAAGGGGATAADVWAYGSRTLTANARTVVISPFSPQDNTAFVVKGDSYDARPLVFENGGNWPDLSGGTVSFHVFDGAATAALFSQNGVVSGSAPVIVSVSLTHTETDQLTRSTGRYNYTLVATVGGLLYTLAFGTLTVVR